MLLNVRSLTTRLPPGPWDSLRKGAVSCLGVFCITAILGYASFNLRTLLALGSFGSSAVLLFAFPETSFSQPRSLVCGHVISSLVGVGALRLFGQTWWALGIAVSSAMALMMLTRTVHPPAGSNPIIAFFTAPDWNFVLFPTLAGAVTMVLVGLAYHRATRRHYPTAWF